MSKILYFLISFVLVLSLAGNVLAYETFIWDNDVGDGNRMWDDASNWDSPGKIDRLPQAKDWVELSDYADACDGPIINADMNAVAMWIDIGYYASGAEVVLTMTGGSLKMGDRFTMGYYNEGYYRFDLSGGTADIAFMLIGYEDVSGYATFNISGGALLNVTGTVPYSNPAPFSSLGYLSVGTNLTLQADINMTGGDVNVAGWFEIGAYDMNTGKGHVDLHGGTIETANLGMGGGGVGTMDFAYDGTLIIDGDYRVPNDWLFDPCSDDALYRAGKPPFTGIGLARFPARYTGTIAILAKLGLITAYNTKVGDIITDVNYPEQVGLRAAINPDYDVTNPGQTTITAGAVDPNLAFNPDPLHFTGGYLQADVNLLSWAAGDNAASHEVYLGTSFDDVNDATIDVNLGVYEGNQPLDDVNYPVSGVWGTTYYWRIDEVNDPNTWKGTVWSFTIIPASATNPRPTGTGVNPLLPVLKWNPGPVVADVNGHYVYFSTDFNDVNERDPNFLILRDTNNFPLGLLELETQYYWAVDEFNDSEDPKLWPSPVLNFTTTDYIHVDTFESYVDVNALNDIWHDWTDPAASPAQDNSEVIDERTIVHDGSRSMEYWYNNYIGGPGAKVRWSESWAYASDLAAGTDWNLGGSSKALVLYFYGDLYNFENQVPVPEGYGADPVYDRMWVGLEDGSGTFAMVHCNDMNEIDEPSWHEWNIRLQDFNDGGVDLTDVNKMYIGFGVRAEQTEDGTEGKVYFDDIRTYPPRCISGLIVADITGDCKTNYADVNIMARDWLMYDYNVAAVAISSPPVGWWPLDEGHGKTTADISGYGNHGTIFNYDWVGSHPDDPNDSALHFDGDAIATYDRVECAERTGSGPGDYPEELMPATFTVACWAKIDSFEYFEGLVANGTDYGEEEGGFYLYSAGFTGGKGVANECFGLMIRTEESVYFVETQNIYKPNTWYHLAATYNDANMVYMYVDGKKVPIGPARSFGVGGPYPKSLGPTDVGGPIKWINDEGNYPRFFLIGAFASLEPDLANWWYGKAAIDDVRVYGYALPPGEIVTLAEQGPARYHDLISAANISDDEPRTSKIVNFRDYAILADYWVGDPILWPLQ